MGFNPAGGAISGATDVALNNPANGQVLTYNGTVAKWANAPSTNGGSASGVSFTPGVGSDLTSTNVQAAITELDNDKAPVNHTHDTADISSGQLSIERLPLGSVILVDKAKSVYGTAGSWPASRPTARTDIVVIWKGDTDPGSIAIAGDEWKVTA